MISCNIPNIMKKTVLLVFAIIAFFWLDLNPALCRTEFETIRLKNGNILTNVIVFSFLDDQIVGICSTGNVTITYDTITKYDRNKIDKILLEIQENKNFIQEQQAKGLVFFQGEWRTAAEADRLKKQQELVEIAKKQQQKEMTFDAKIEKLVDSQSTNKATFKVLQNLQNGFLCSMGEWIYGTLYFSGDFCFVENKGFTKQAIAVGTIMTENLYWGGTYSYTTARNEDKTVTRYYLDRSLAIEWAKVNHRKK
jgi:hypothetical protein